MNLLCGRVTPHIYRSSPCRFWMLPALKNQTMLALPVPPELVAPPSRMTAASCNDEHAPWRSASAQRIPLCAAAPACSSEPCRSMHALSMHALNDARRTLETALVWKPITAAAPAPYFTHVKRVGFRLPLARIHTRQKIRSN